MRTGGAMAADTVGPSVAVQTPCRCRRAIGADYPQPRRRSGRGWRKGRRKPCAWHAVPAPGFGTIPGRIGVQGVAGMGITVVSDEVRGDQVPAVVPGAGERHACRLPGGGHR
jgi:hypothetical protein